MDGAEAQRGSWAAAAGVLGLRLVMVPESALIGAGFAVARRAAESPSISGALTSPWLVGTRDDVGVVVRIENFGGTIYTTVAAEIAPPLFVGLRVTPMGLQRFGAVGGHPDHHGWGELAVFARDRGRALAILDADDGDLRGGLLALARGGGVAVQDGLVEVLVASFMSEARHLEVAVASSVSVARLLSERAEKLSPTPDEAERLSGWQAFAANEGLAFDMTRRRMHGRVRAIEVDIGLEPSPAGIFTTVRAKLRWSAAAGLHLRRDPRGLLVARRAPAPDSVHVGDADFDAQFKIDATDITAATELLKEPKARALLSQVSSVSADLVMNDREIIASQMAWLAPAELWERMQTLVRVVEIVTPEAKIGPYR